MNGAIYIFGEDQKPPYKVGAAANPRTRYWQLRANDATVTRLRVSTNLTACRFLALWDCGHPGIPRGVESELLRDLKAHRLSYRAAGKNGIERDWLTEWVDLPLKDLTAFVENHPWMRRFARLEPAIIVPNPTQPRGHLQSRKDALIEEIIACQSTLTALDSWRSDQDPEPSRPEAIRYALRDWLTGMGLIPLSKK